MATKKQTVGQRIEALAEEMSRAGTLGFFMLERALEVLSEEPYGIIKLNGKLIQDTEGYKKIKARDAAILARIGKE